MTIKELRDKNCIFFECITGSQAYGLSTQNSDTDIKGVFILPKEYYYSLNYIDQINENNNNVSFIELKKFMELLSRNNPNILEMLNMPEDCILFKHTLFDQLRSSDFLSKLCSETFAGYAITQLKKARGLNKKILNPMDEKRKSVLDFCYVIQGQGSVPLVEFLQNKNLNQRDCGLSVIPHMREVYGLYFNGEGFYKGIISDDKAMDISLSSIKQGESPIAIMSFNKDGYSRYCKDYSDYFSWVKNRNDFRYQNTMEHGKNYDAKNMMHTFRLLDMALEIAKNGVINVRRTNREYLLDIKAGKFEYDELVSRAELRVKEIQEAFSKSTLPEFPDWALTNKLLISIRQQFYQQ